MERRVLIAIFLSFIVLYAYQAFVVKPAPKPQQSASQAAQSAKPVTAGAAKPAPSQAAQAAALAPAAAALVADSTERDIRIETRDVIAVLTNRGARLKSWRLKKYLDQDRKPQELVENQLATQPLPFTLTTADVQALAAGVHPKG
jgi:YidC/Oxa1 family membrane protein insertase